MFAVGEGGAGVDHDGGGVYFVGESLCGGDIGGADCFGVAAGVAADVVEGPVDAVDGAGGDVHAEVFVGPVGVGGGHDGGSAEGCEFFGVAVDGDAGVLQRGNNRKFVLVAEVGVDEDGFGGVADATAAGFAVEQYGDGLA